MREPAERTIVWGLLACILAGSFGLKLNNLGHRSIKGLDEVFHAIVARNLMKHPLTPMLYKRHYLPHDESDWQNATIWLHKPPMALWQAAASFKLLGESPLALRLPSALQATGAALLTYLIGAILFNRRVGLIAAALHAFNPATFMLVHGYTFSDHVDVAMLFWTELGILFVVRAFFLTQSKRDIVLAGVAQGFALLSKTYPALIITGVALIACLVTRGPDRRLRGRHVAVLFGVSILVIAPWTIWCVVRFPHEFLAEQALILRHLHTDVENWAGPWDRLIFDYLGRSFHVFYPMLLASVALLAWRAWRERDAQIAVVLAWFFGVVIPHVIATSKTPSAALVGWPAGWLLIACAIDRAIRGDALLQGACAVTAVLGIVWRGTFPDTGMGYSSRGAFGVLRENSWYAWQALIAIAGGIAFQGMTRRLVPRDRRGLGLASIVLAVAASVVLSARYAQVSWRVTMFDRNEPAYMEIGRYARSSLPANAVFLVDETQKLEHKQVMFWTHRTAYPLFDSPELLAARIHEQGGGRLISSHLASCRFPLSFAARKMDGLCIAFASDPSQIAQFPPNRRWHEPVFSWECRMAYVKLGRMEEVLPPQTEHGAGFERTRVPQFTIFLENRVGRLSGLLRALEESVGTINALSIEESADSALVRLICADPNQGREALRSGGFSFSETEILAVELPKKSRQPLLSICTALLSAELNIHYAYPLLTRPRGPAIALYVDDPTLAAQILIRKGYVLIGESDLKV